MSDTNDNAIPDLNGGNLHPEALSGPQPGSPEDPVVQISLSGWKQLTSVIDNIATEVNKLRVEVNELKGIIPHQPSPALTEALASTRESVDEMGDILARPLEVPPSALRRGAPGHVRPRRLVSATEPPAAKNARRKAA